MKEVKNVLFYDGDCAMCNHTVNFVLKHEKGKELFFSSLQSEFAKKELSKFNYDFTQMATFALIKEGEVHYKSAAALRVSLFLKMPYSWFIVFIIVPPFIRNAVYDFVATRRKTWFKKDFCVMPEPETRKRFLD